MKKIFLLGAMLVCGLVANAQFVLTPQVGGVMSTVTGQDDAKMKFGLVAGANLEYPVTEAFSVSGGLLYTMQGCKVKNDLVDFKVEGEYLNIPILAQYQVYDGIKIKAGIQPGILMSAKYNGDSKFKDECNKLDWSIPMGISYEISDFVIDARYNLGVSKINKNNEFVDKDIKNSVIMVTLGYRIPF